MLTEATPIQVLLPLSAIPDGSDVTMRTGQKIYRVTREVRVFAKAGAEGTHSIKLAPGTTGLMSGSDINVYPDTHEVLWHTTIEAINDHIRDLREEEDAQ